MACINIIKYYNYYKTEDKAKRIECLFYANIKQKKEQKCCSI